MRGLWTWLLVFGVIAGFSSRILAVEHVHVEPASSHCEDGHSHDPCDDGHKEHQSDCPTGPHEHHHSHTCCHAAPLMAVQQTAGQRLAMPHHFLLGVTWLTALPPDEPVFALDKPPLI